MAVLNRITNLGFCVGSFYAAVALGQADARVQIFRFQGQYSVPVNDGTPTEFSQFPVGKVKIVIRDNIPKIQYIFPKALDGIGTDLEFRGTIAADGSWVFTDPIGELKCMPTAEGTATCQAHYPGLVTDATARSAVLAAMAGSPAELQSRQKVAVAFEDERIGILELTPDAAR